MKTQIIMNNGNKLEVDKDIENIRLQIYQALSKNELMEIDEDTYINAMNISEIKKYDGGNSYPITDNLNK